MYAIVDTRNRVIRVVSKSYDLVRVLLEGFDDRWGVYTIERIRYERQIRF